MNASGNVCETSGRYSAYGPCGHAVDRCVVAGDVFPQCPVCSKTVHWTLLHVTDAWGDYVYQEDAPDSRLLGMTVNERLYEARLLHQFDEAAKARDRDCMIALLRQVSLSPPAAERVADVLLARPMKSD